MTALVLLLSLVVVVALGCGDPDAKCREASEKASYSIDHGKMTEGMDYFAENCTWRDGAPVAR